MPRNSQGPSKSMPHVGMSRFLMRKETGAPVENPWVTLRLTKTWPTCNDTSWGGRRDWWPPFQHYSLRNTARDVSQMVSHPVIHLVQQGLSLGNTGELLSSFWLIFESPITKKLKSNKVIKKVVFNPYASCLIFCLFVSECAHLRCITQCFTKHVVMVNY